MRIHREGVKIIPIAFFFIAVLDALIYFFLKEYLIFYFLMGASLILAGLIVYFFRVPMRVIDKNPNHILAPADGDVVEIIKVHEKEYFK
ncbi:MAG TPA: phosphatidylserine decarboxylase, partial [Prolixibacteraceae bacterium]|nr:phosphatidylserine decarboxylase [Prolixibacteraceae bacterium]